jgi:hypothetical protein
MKRVLMQPWLALGKLSRSVLKTLIVFIKAFMRLPTSLLATVKPQNKARAGRSPAEYASTEGRSMIEYLQLLPRL